MACTLHLADGATAPTLTGYALILPCLSIGNIDQLALDLLLNTSLSSSACTRVGSLSCPPLREVVGLAAFDSIPGPSFALELFIFPSQRVAVLQQRAAAVDGAHEPFAAAIVAWAATQCISRVVAVTCADAALQPDAVRGRGRCPLVFLTTDPTPAHAGEDSHPLAHACGALRWPLKPAATQDAAVRAAAGEEGAEEGAPSAAVMAATAAAFDGLWGAGYAPVYHRRVLAGAAPLEWSTLVMFASEGENMAEAARLAHALAAVTGVLAQDAPLIPPAYFAQLAGPPVDLATGMFGF